MRTRARGNVISVEAERLGAQEILVNVGGDIRAAVNYISLTGGVMVGDQVTLNMWAVEMGLGTGGVDFVTDVDKPAPELVPPGHIMKLRYTPLQHPVLAAESPESPFHEAVDAFQTLNSTPVICAELHSQLPAIAVAAKWETGHLARVVYVMTEGAALPLAFSRLVPELKERGYIDATVTAGHSFGGDFEAVNLYSAIVVAKVAARADIIIVCQGPGNTGTSTPLGFSGIDQGVALNAASCLGGTSIAVARLSFADPRPRHVGLSYHTRTVLERITQCAVLVPIPRLPDVERYHLKAALDEGELRKKHEFFTVYAEKGLNALIESGIPVTTMGRGIKEERAFFLSATSAGLLAGQWFDGSIGDALPL